MEDPETLFFTDTSFLLFWGSLHPAARTALADWVTGIGPGRFHVPTWAAQEVYRHLGKDNGQALAPMGKLASDVVLKLDEIRSEARRFVDDAVSAAFQGGGGGLRDRAAFLVELDREVGRFASRARYLKQAATDRLEETSEFLAGIVNGHLMPGGVYGALPTIEAEYQARLVGDHPPGQKDKGKDANRYGDLLVWREIVDFCHGREVAPTSVVLLTNDNKPDWVYRPPSMTHDPAGDGVIRTTPNNGRHGFQIIFPQPLLTHELGAGRADFSLHIVNLQMLARLKADNPAFADLAHAYSAIVREEPATEAEPEPDGAQGVPEEVGAPARGEVELLPLDELRTALGNIDRSAEAAAALAAILTRGVTLQEARGVGRSIVEATAAGREPAELLGRALLGNQYGLAEEIWSALLEGILLGAYFAPDGRRRIRPVASLELGLFAVAQQGPARSAVNRFTAEIGSASRSYLLLPGDDGNVALTVAVRRRARRAAHLEAVMRGDVRLLVDGRRGAPNSLAVLADGSLEEPVSVFRRLLARHFVVPEQSIGLNLALADMVSWDELQCLVDWGTDSGPRLR